MNIDGSLAPSTSLALLQARQVDSEKTLSKLQSDIDLTKVEETAREFEAVFISEMMKPMFEGLETDGMFGGGKGEEVFRSLMLQEYGKMISQTGSIGIASQVKSALIQMQSEQSQ